MTMSFCGRLATPITRVAHDASALSKETQR